MELENTGNEWMNEAPQLLATDKKNPFTVPENYFSELKANIHSRCVIEDARFSEEEEFSVPEGYFESLSTQISDRIAEENIRALAPADGFTVPADYFTGLEQRILAKVRTDDKNDKVIIKPIRSNWVRYAAAASVTVVLGSLLVFNNQNKSIDSQLSSLPDQEIISYLQMHSDMGDTPEIMEGFSQSVNLIEMDTDISDAELEEYINTTL